MPAAYRPSGTSGDDARHRHSVDLEARFLEALEACRDLAMHVALEIVESPDAAQDVVQEAAARVWASLDACREPDKLESQVLTAAKNLALNMRRDDGHRDELMRANPSPPPQACTPSPPTSTQR